MSGKPVVAEKVQKELPKNEVPPSPTTPPIEEKKHKKRVSESKERLQAIIAAR